MEKRADIVIGANFGDEGKGLVTDYLASRYEDDALVVRHNGGAQAGHTVTTPDGKRHVFKHFGSGSFAGAKTYLSRFFACNPIIFFQEKEKLEKLNVHTFVYVDAAAPITTPYDMMINQISEETRGNGRHGSCGVGYGETIERCTHPDFVLHFVDLANKDQLRQTLTKIRDEWVPKRLKALGFAKPSAEWVERISSNTILEWYLDMAQKFYQSATLAPHDLLQTSPHIIFEGAQGLLLDQDGEWFPHVTRSNTGIRNALTLARESGIDKIDVTYITRAYLTRHGAGPLPHELDVKPYKNIVDETNIPNDYQGALRFAHLNLDLLTKTIFADLKHGEGFAGLTHRLAITCMDQTGDDIIFINHGHCERTDHADFLAKVRARGFDRLLLSFGPTRQTVIKHEDTLSIIPSGFMPEMDAIRMNG